MAQTLTTEIPVRITLNATAGKVTLLTVSDSAFYITVRWISGTEGFLTTNVADGIDKGSAYLTFDAGQNYTIALGARGKSGLFGLASDTNSGVVEVCALGSGK